MELNENLERRGRCKLPLSKREVAMPRASVGFVHDTKVSGLLWTIDHLHGSRNAQGVVFLKNLDTLFCGYRGIFNSGNTIIVDNNPLKHIMNRPENVLLPNPWSNRGNGDRDTFLLCTLLPWFQQLHLAHYEGLKSFREHGPNRIGQKMLCDERNRIEYKKVMEVV